MAAAGCETGERDHARHKLHARFFLGHLTSLPSAYAGADTNRMSLLYFALMALEVLGEGGEGEPAVDATTRAKLCDWVYAMQIVPQGGTGEGREKEKEGAPFQSVATTEWERSGFRGSPYIGLRYSTEAPITSPLAYDCGHLAMDYTALVVLYALGGDLSRVRRLEILREVKACQVLGDSGNSSDGCFSATREGCEADMRFLCKWLLPLPRTRPSFRS